MSGFQQAEHVELSELGEQPLGTPVLIGQSAALLEGVSVTVSAFVGAAQATLGALMNLKDGTVFKLDREVQQPLDLIVNGKVVARGELVVVDDCFGVRVTEIARQVQS